MMKKLIALAFVFATLTSVNAQARQLPEDIMAGSRMQHDLKGDKETLEIQSPIEKTESLITYAIGGLTIAICGMTLYNVYGWCHQTQIQRESDLFMGGLLNMLGICKF